jgi:urease accessory protein
MPMPITDADTGGDGGLLQLLAWLSPGFPVGAYAYSHGIEYAVDTGRIGTPADLADWLAAIVSEGSAFADAVFLAHAWRAEAAGDDQALALIAERADAFRGGAEAAVESAAQGRAFLDAVQAGWPHPRLEAFRAMLALLERPPAYAVAVGVAAAIALIAERTAVIGFLHAVAANLVSAGIRLIPLGQTQGVALLAALEPVIRTTAYRALVTGLDDIGTSTWMVDWTMARHETQYTRLFRS